jgi:hypothetical protein
MAIGWGQEIGRMAFGLYTWSYQMHEGTGWRMQWWIPSACFSSPNSALATPANAGQRATRPPLQEAVLSQESTSRPMCAHADCVRAWITLHLQSSHDWGEEKRDKARLRGRTRQISGGERFLKGDYFSYKELRYGPLSVSILANRGKRSQ